MKNIKVIFYNRFKIAFLFFIISALYGVTLRLFPLVDFIPFSYKNILQSHSHVTFLGWGFLAVITIIGFVFYSKKHTNSTYNKWLFYIMVSTLFGMLISFPLQGYKTYSILLLSVFLITSYLYLIQTLRNLKSLKSLSSKFIKTGIYYYFLSSFAVWAVAIITTKLGKTDLYYNTVYFYLHFLYNGFFVFTLFGLFIRYIEYKQIPIKSAGIWLYRLTNITLIPAYALSLLWSKVPNYTYIISFFAVCVQIVSLSYLYKIFKPFNKYITNKRVQYLTYFVFTSYVLKIFLQFFSAFPSIIKVALQLKSFFIIGYLHLFTLGFMSVFILLLVKLHVKDTFNKHGINLLLTGILLSEILLFSQGSLLLFLNISIPKIKILLVIVSTLIPLGLLIIYLKDSPNKIK